ncbi:unnamed protein product [Closterium sp. NIES-53]
MPTMEHDASRSPRPLRAEESASFVDGVDFDVCISFRGLLSRRWTSCGLPCRRHRSLCGWGTRKRGGRGRHRSHTFAVNHLRLYRCPALTLTDQRPSPTSHHRYHLRSASCVARADNSTSSGQHRLPVEGALWASLPPASPHL